MRMEKQRRQLPSNSLVCSNLKEELHLASFKNPGTSYKPVAELKSYLMLLLGCAYSLGFFMAITTMNDI